MGLFADKKPTDVTVESGNTLITVYMNNEIEKPVFLEINKSYMYSNNLHPKISIPNNIFSETFRNTCGLTLKDTNFDIIRTTPMYAFKFNSVVSKYVEKVVDENGLEIFPHMKNYTDGYSFVGDAFIHFVAALAVYEMFPDESSSSLTNLATSFRNNNNLADIYTKVDMSPYISKVKKSNIMKRQSNRQLAGSFKGLVGMLYKENGIDNMFNILRFVNNEIVPYHTLLFNKKADVISLATIILSTLFGWISCYITLTLYHISSTL